jgi:hypothetical protein
MRTSAFNRRWSVGLAVLLGATVGVTLLVRYFHGPDREAYLAKNERIVVGLPRPRGTDEIGRQMFSNEESWGEQLSHTVGYSTHVSYAVPNAMTGESIVRFYKDRMTGWHRESWTVDGISIACFDRNGATVAVDTTGMKPLGGATRKTYTIIAIHEGGTCD